MREVIGGLVIVITMLDKMSGAPGILSGILYFMGILQ